MKKIIKSHHILLVCLTIIFVFFAQAVLATTKQPSKLIGIKLTASKSKSNVTFTLVGATPYHLVTLTNPHRIILDLDSAQLATPLPLSPAKTLILKRIHNATSKKKNALRIILELSTAVNVKSFVNNSADKTQLLLELTPQEKKIIPMHSDKSAAISSSHTRQTSLNKTRDDYASLRKKISEEQTKKLDTKRMPRSDHQRLQRESQHEDMPPVERKKMRTKSHSRNVIVVIDPGHGGKDPGARGPHRSNEKHVVLAISKELQRQLNAYPGIRAVLTRNGDYFLDLRQRLRIARKYKAELFIAIHADAAYNNSAHGASVFALSQRGASSEAARWLAEKENYSELGQVHLEDKNYQLRSVLLDLSQTATINQSVQVGQVILKGLERVCTLHCRKVEQARFVVLKSPDIPSLLIETGFISNPQEEWRLNNPAYQRQLAQAMAYGIKAFFWRNPPPGSVFYPSA